MDFTGSELSTFHNRCVQTILDVSRFEQWQNHITSQHLSGKSGLYWSIADFASVVAGPSGVHG